MADGGRDRGILFDLFGTLVHFDSTRIPTLEVPGGRVRSTLAACVSILAEAAPGVELVTFHETLRAVSDEIARDRGKSHRELPSRERFARALRRHAGPGTDLEACAERLSLVHMEQLVAAAEAPVAHRALLARLAKIAPLGCISNFDHAPSAHRVLERTGLAPYLRVVIVSASFGLRKPSPAIFREGVRALGVAPERSIFVGDSIEDDIRGARSVGLRAVWLNPAGVPPPPDLTPDETIRELTDVEALVAG
jgi:HAD superfamily hydrolase (TIGR01549 family)